MNLSDKSVWEELERGKNVCKYSTHEENSQIFKIIVLQSNDFLSYLIIL